MAIYSIIKRFYTGDSKSTVSEFTVFHTVKATSVAGAHNKFNIEKGSEIFDILSKYKVTTTKTFIDIINPTDDSIHEDPTFDESTIEDATFDEFVERMR
jgi:hypothetical protein